MDFGKNIWSKPRETYNKDDKLPHGTKQVIVFEEVTTENRKILQNNLNFDL